MHYQWLKTNHHIMHSKWNNDHGFSGYTITGSHQTISHIKNHSIVYIAQRQTTFKASFTKNQINQKNTFIESRPLSNNSIVDIYILDSGIDTTHPDFEGRASWGWPKVKSKRDVFGHGTHVAGIAGSRSFGVSKNANLIAVKVLDDDGIGSSTAVINGVHYILDRAKRFPGRKAIINISFSGPKDLAVDHVLNLAVKKGIAVVAAAGNDGSDACDFSPSRSSMVITVGAINDHKSKTLFSNDGSCVNAWAVGVAVLSVWPNGRTRRLDGTSASAPKIAGKLSLIWEENPKIPIVLLYKKLSHYVDVNN